MTTTTFAPVTIQWTERDTWRPLTLSGVAVLVLGPLFARFGLPNVSLMWPLYRLGIMLPSCGLTRAVVAAFRGDLGRAWQFNPLSFIVIVLAGALGVRLGIGVASGRWFAVRVSAQRLLALISVTAIAVLFLNQQLHARLLTDRLR